MPRKRSIDRYVLPWVHGICYVVDECGQVNLKPSYMGGIDSTPETIFGLQHANRPCAVRRVAGAARAPCVLNWCAPGPISWRPIKSTRSFRMTRIMSSSPTSPCQHGHGAEPLLAFKSHRQASFTVTCPQNSSRVKSSEIVHFR